MKRLLAVRKGGLMTLAFVLLACAGMTTAAEVVVDDGSTNSRRIASNVPANGNVWTSMAQSFTATDSRITFGFRLFDENASLPNQGDPIIYRLFSGENVYHPLLAVRVVTMPGTLSDDPRSIYGDVGFVEADFSEIFLTVGQRYTVEVTIPAGDLPEEGDAYGVSVWTSLVNPYPDGRFYFPVGYDNQWFADQDMLFRIAPRPLEMTPDEALLAVQALLSDVSRVMTVRPSPLTAIVARLRVGEFLLMRYSRNPSQTNLAQMCRHVRGTARFTGNLSRLGLIPLVLTSDWVFRIDAIAEGLGCD